MQIDLEAGVTNRVGKFSGYHEKRIVDITTRFAVVHWEDYSAQTLISRATPVPATTGQKGSIPKARRLWTLFSMLLQSSRKRAILYKAFNYYTPLAAGLARVWELSFLPNFARQVGTIP